MNEEKDTEKVENSDSNIEDLIKNYSDVGPQPTTNNQDTKQEKEVYLTPKDVVNLPSLGKVYPVNSSLYGKEYVEVRHLTAADEDILTSRSLLRTNKAIDYLLSNCLLDKNINPEELLSGDKNAILTFLRVTGYGPEYNVNINCPSCGEEVEHEFDMSQLDMNVLNIDPVQPGENRFEFTMPDGKLIEFKYLNSAEERALSDTQEKIKKATKSPIDHNVTSALKSQIISVDGQTDKKFINNYVDNMPVRNSRAFRKYLSDNDPDLIMKQEFECPHCGAREEVEIPITVTFFWPDAE